LTFRQDEISRRVNPLELFSNLVIKAWRECISSPVRSAEDRVHDFKPDRLAFS